MADSSSRHDLAPTAKTAAIDVVIPTREQLRQRRQHLQRQRRHRLLQGAWRIGLSLTLLTGLVVGLRQSFWSLHDPNQIQIEGNHLLSDDQIRARLPIELPTNLWQLEPQALAETLIGPDTDQLTPVRAVQASRQLLPPGLKIVVEERHPIARTMVNGIAGLVDRDGVWLSLEHYPDLVDNEDLPQLILEGWEHHPAPEWVMILEMLPESSVHILGVNWPAGEGVSLDTEIGGVYLGSVTPDRLGLQLEALDQMRDLKQYCECDPNDIDYIDLSSPKVPTIQLTSAAAAERWQEEEVLPDLP